MRPAWSAIGSPWVTLMSWSSGVGRVRRRRTRASRRLPGAAAQPACGLVGVDVGDLAPRVQRLHAVPERHAEQLLVMGEEHLHELAPEPEEGPEFLGEDIALAHVVPKLAGRVIPVVRRMRHFPEPALRERAQLVVVEEDEPT